MDGPLRLTGRIGLVARPTGEKLIVDNRRARHDYHLLDRVEAGLVLTGTEVKSLREGRASIKQNLVFVVSAKFCRLPMRMHCCAVSMTMGVASQSNEQ